jgi:phosphoribosylanthranilate isomerase
MFVKVCGLTRQEDVDLAVTSGANAVGFVQWSGSPRAVRPDVVAKITRNVPAGVLKVGVFVNASPADVATAIAVGGLTAVQLHGDENVDDYLHLGARVIKAVAPLSREDVDRACAIADEVVLLVDAHDPERRGGTGRTADWSLAAQLASRRPVILAGGLHAGNLRAAIDAVRPWGVDTSSGVEVSPGIKDHNKLRAFLNPEPRTLNPEP